MARGECAEGCGEVFKQHGRAAALGTDDTAGRWVDEPGFGGAGEHDLARCVALGRIDEHILHAGEAGELLDLVGDAAAVGGVLRQRLFEPRERHLAERDLLS